MSIPIKGILMVCTGNICRSPTAHGVMEQMIKDFGLKVKVASCGTTGMHVGQMPDSRAMLHAAKRGYDLSSIRAAEIVESDFINYDLVLCMDRSHMQVLRKIHPEYRKDHVHLFTSIFDDNRKNIDVPDPYYGGADDFEHALDLIEDGCRGWMKRL